MDDEGRAVCGLVCENCPIYRATYDINAAIYLLGWFKEMNVISRHEGVDELMDSGPYCQGCQGPRATHWSPDCWILECCVDGQGLSACYQCTKFPCNELKHWSTQDEKYASAFDYLMEKHHSIKR